MGLCTSTNRTSQVLEALDLFYGFRHCRSVEFVDDSAGDLSGEYWDVNLINENYDEVKYVFYMDSGSETAPTVPTGTTTFAIPYNSDDSASAIATALKNAVDGDATLSALLKVEVDSSNDAKVEYQNRFLGLISDEVSTNASSFTFEVGQAGSGGYLGAIAQGGGSLTTEQTLADLTSDQTGAIILDQIIQGGAITFDVSLVEMTSNRWKFLVGEGFGASTTVSMEDLVGYGTSKLYKSSFDFSGQLVGHPIRLPRSNRSADICMWKASANLNSINYSGQDVQAAEMTFSALRDTTKPEEISLFARGDHSLV